MGWPTRTDQCLDEVANKIGDARIHASTDLWASLTVVVVVVAATATVVVVVCGGGGGDGGGGTAAAAVAVPAVAAVLAC